MSALESLPSAGLAAAAGSVGVFVLACLWLRGKPRRRQVAWLSLSGLLALPAIAFSLHYLHVLPEWAWFYELRAWPGSEWLMLLAGLAAGTAAALLPRCLLPAPLGLLAAGALLPYVKPAFGPIPDRAFSARWQGAACLQRTASTCGPAAVCTILRQLGIPATEKELAREAWTSQTGTEAWYLARAVRRRGCQASFVFREHLALDAGLPALAGVVMRGGSGHFIAILAAEGDHVTIADPVSGGEVLTRTELRDRYAGFTGFHLVIQPPGER